MTCIAAYKNYLVTDSMVLITARTHGLDQYMKQNKLIIDPRKYFAMGISGELPNGSVLTDLIDAVRSCVIKNYSNPTEGVKKSGMFGIESIPTPLQGFMRSSILMTSRATYLPAGDNVMIPKEDAHIACLGTGATYFQAASAIGHEPEEAMKIVCRLDPRCSFPVNIIKQSDLRAVIVKKA